VSDETPTYDGHEPDYDKPFPQPDYRPDRPLTKPDAIAIDANGNGWRVWDGFDGWSMVPTNPDNSEIPQPLTWYRRTEAPQ
jgi:hypothetical protein